MIIESLSVITLALLLDFIFGDPKNKYHPTAWIGSLIAKLTPLCKNSSDVTEKFRGAILILSATGIVAT
ncbi:MAG: cobalamin biosynthesis protein, partial [Nitrosopumilaceae archaeon]